MKDAFRRLLWRLFFPMEDWPFCQECDIYCNARERPMQKNYITHRWEYMCNSCAETNRMESEKREQEYRSRAPRPSTNR